VPDDAPLQPPTRLSPASPPSYRPGRAGRTLDQGTRTLMIGAGVVLSLLLLLAGYWAVSGRHGGVVPTIQADKQPWRVKPDNPGGMQVIGASERGDVPGQPGATAPAPEAPAPEALRAAQPAPEPRPAVPLSTSPDQDAANSAAVTPVPPTAAAPAPAPRSPAPAAGTTLVQLAALDTEAGAHTEWQRLKGRMVDLLANRQPVFQRIEREGHTLWRLRVGGFSSIADATRFCERVRTKGGGCELATF
jgi:hypothetical protein